MFQIKSSQLEVFKEYALKNFDNVMLSHIGKYFPEHLNASGVGAMQNTIGDSRKEVVKYKFSSKRNVCLYLNNMIMLGSHFDVDPQYPWVNEILNNTKEEIVNERIDKLSDKSLEVFEKFTGNGQINLLNLFKRISDDSGEIILHLKNNFKSNEVKLRELFPGKYEVIGDEAINRMMYKGTRAANGYGINSESGLTMYFAMMLVLGSGFDVDPQFPWASKILNEGELSDQSKKINVLMENFIIYSRAFHS